MLLLMKTTKKNNDNGGLLRLGFVRVSAEARGFGLEWSSRCRGGRGAMWTTCRPCFLLPRVYDTAPNFVVVAGDEMAEP